MDIACDIETCFLKDGFNLLQGTVDDDNMAVALVALLLELSIASLSFLLLEDLRWLFEFEMVFSRT